MLIVIVLSLPLLLHYCIIFKNMFLLWPLQYSYVIVNNCYCKEMLFFLLFITKLIIIIISSFVYLLFPQWKEADQTSFMDSKLKCVFDFVGDSDDPVSIGVGNVSYVFLDVLALWLQKSSNSEFVRGDPLWKRPLKYIC